MTRQIVIRELPTGRLGPEHFELRDKRLPDPGPGEARMRTLLMSIDAANRAWMQGATYREAVKVGDVMHTYAIGQITASNDPALAPGDIVAAEAGFSPGSTMLRALTLARLRMKS